MGKVIKWTDEELELLRRHYPDDSWETILSLIHRNKGNIITKASKLGIVRNSSNKKVEWSDDEIEILKQVYLTTKIVDIPKLYLPGKSKDSVIKMMGKLRLLKSRQWTNDEIDKFIELYPSTDNNELCKIFNRTYDAIINEAVKLEISKDNRFTEEDIEFIKDNYMKMSDYDIGIVLHHNWRVIKCKRLSYGWKHYEPILGQDYKDITNYCRNNTVHWRNESMKYCGYKCVITGSNFDEVHHLYSANLIMKEIADELDIIPSAKPSEYSPEKLEEIANLFDEKQMEHGYGVCLTKELHKMFHSEYGFGDNTREQFLDFVNKHGFSLLVNI